MDDAAEFRAVRAALADVGVDSAAQAAVWGLLSGLLWLGNIDFEESGDGTKVQPPRRAVCTRASHIPCGASLHAPASAGPSLVAAAAHFILCARPLARPPPQVRQTEALTTAASLLGVSCEALVAGLTTRRIVAPGEVVIKLLKLPEASEARDALAKAIYAALFAWLVARVNERLGPGHHHHGHGQGQAQAQQGAGGHAGLSISILDIYGFEQFDRNSFEQLCINYANERLQQQVRLEANQRVAMCSCCTELGGMGLSRRRGGGPAAALPRCRPGARPDQHSAWWQPAAPAADPSSARHRPQRHGAHPPPPPPPPRLGC